MSSTWIYIMIVMIVGNFALQALPIAIYVPGVIVVHLFVLLISYFLLRRDKYTDLKANMLFILGLTVINVLVDLNIMSQSLSWIAFGALLMWSMLGGGSSK